MFKKILITSAIIAATSSSAFANTSPYVGISTGLNVNTVNVSNGNNNIGVLNYRGVPFNLFAGYGGIVSQNFYLAGEITGTVATAEVSGGSLLKTTYGFAASVIPGVMLCDHTLAYARLGIIDSKFDNNSSMRTGGQFGLGLQTSLTQNVDLRGEYDFAAYRSINAGNNVTVSPRSDQFSVGLVYKFE